MCGPRLRAAVASPGARRQRAAGDSGRPWPTCASRGALLPLVEGREDIEREEKQAQTANSAPHPRGPGRMARTWREGPRTLGHSLRRPAHRPPGLPRVSEGVAPVCAAAAAPVAGDGTNGRGCSVGWRFR